MPQKVAIVADPGIDTAFAVALAFYDPRLEVVALCATAGNVASQQATRNVHILVEQMDPPKWPQLGAALPVEYEIDGREMHGPDGLGGTYFPCSTLHNIHPSDRVLVETVRIHPSEVIVVCLGPATVLSAALDREPELPNLIKRVILVGGSVQEPGDAGPVSEFHFTCDPVAARHVLRSQLPVTIVPLDVMRTVLLSPADLLELPNAESRTTRFLKRIAPYGIGATSNRFGIEGLHLLDVPGVVAASLPSLLSTEPVSVDIETRGELTRGMLVIDRRIGVPHEPNAEVATDIEIESVRNYISQVLAEAS